MRVTRFLAAMVLGASLVGSAAAAPLEPLIVGWERFFVVSWEASDRGDRPHISGYVRNESGHRATRVQLLVEGLDGSGRVVSQQVNWLGTDLPAFTRTYFEVPAPARAPTYRVRVFAFDVLQAARVESP
ncbi:MAG: FxLYD domain-containing protein [Candidatus Rokuibacteriota bacterium]